LLRQPRAYLRDVVCAVDLACTAADVAFIVGQQTGAGFADTGGTGARAGRMLRLVRLLRFIRFARAAQVRLLARHDLLVLSPSSSTYLVLTYSLTRSSST